ncbi:MAG: VCBS repeat-containing protein, partial [Deltaproteobacteria bacterium]|nr:VCBS repeat-containing protein [Deltaproteobacteria bacterium]
GTASGGGGQGGSTTCGNGQVDPGEVCFTAPYEPYETGKRQAADMVLTDCDGDGDVDVITADEGAGTFTVLTNDGEGMLEPPESYTHGLEGVVRITLAELGGSAQPELLAVGDAGSAAESFVEFSISDCSIDGGIGGSSPGIEVTGSPRDVTVVRFADDILDDPVVTLLVGEAGELAFFDTAEGPDPTATQFAAGTNGVAGIVAGNLYGNALTDIAHVNPGANEVIVWMNSGSAFTLAGSYPVGTEPTAVAVGDLDGQDFDDIVVANTAASTISVLLNNGLGDFTQSGGDLEVGTAGGVHAREPRDVHLADLDGDGDLDILTANSDDSPTAGQSSVSLFLNDGSGAFLLATSANVAMVQTSFPLEVGLLPSKVWAADMNGDGALDIVTSGTHVDDDTSHVSVLLAVP